MNKWRRDNIYSMIIPSPNVSYILGRDIFRPNDANIGDYSHGFRQSEHTYGLGKYSGEQQSLYDFENLNCFGSHTVSQQRYRRTPHPDLISPLTTDEIIITSVRDISYADAKEEIIKYKESMGNRKVYISEIAEKLKIDFDLIESIVDELQNE
jgi:hypothetical protein